MGLVSWELRIAGGGEKLCGGREGKARRQASPESSGLFPGWLIGLDKQDGD